MQVGSAGNEDVNLGKPTGAGNLLVVAIETDENPVSSVTDNHNNMYTFVPGSRARNDVEALGLELWYLPRTTLGIERITASGVATVYGMVAWEVAGLDGTLDKMTKVDNQAASPAPFGPAITTANDGEFVVSVLIVANAIERITMGNEFTNDKRVEQNGWAHLTSATAPAGSHRARWDGTDSGTACGATAAFY